MRLASLARKIKIKPSELRSFLEENDIPLPSDSNTKLGEDAVDLVYRNFAPQYIDQEVEITETNAVEQQVEEVPENLVVQKTGEVSENEGPKAAKPKEWSDELEPITEPEENINLDTGSEEEEEEVELIKAPKVTLPGLTIKGKIDLPEPKPRKETEEEKSQDDDNRKSRQSRNSDRRNRKGKRQDRDFNPLAEERKRKASEEERRRKEQAQRRKEQRRRRYEENIRSKIESQRATQVTQSSKTEVVQTSPEKKKSPTSNSHKPNMMARLWKWLNS